MMEVGGGEGAVFEIVLCLQTRNGQELRCLGDPREILSSVIHNGVDLQICLGRSHKWDRVSRCNMCIAWKVPCSICVCSVTELHPHREGGEEATVAMGSAKTLS